MSAQQEQVRAPVLERPASERRVRLVSAIRQSFKLPSARQSVLAVLPREDYERYLEAPEVLTRLSMKRHLATGAQASVYLMEDSVSGSLCAAKVTALLDPEQVRLAVKEYAILRSLEHPGIVSPLSFWIDQELSKAMLLMPYEGEQTLADVGVLPENQVRSIGVQLFQSLAHLQKHNIAHRDVKPANVLYSEGKTTLIDFQTALLLKDAQWAMSYAGTKAFVAPEMCSQSLYTAKVDVWSGAAVLLFLLGFSSLANLSGVSRDCAAWFKAAMERDPERRLSAEEALRHSWMATAPA